MKTPNAKLPTEIIHLVHLSTGSAKRAIEVAYFKGVQDGLEKANEIYTNSIKKEGK